MKEEKGRGKEHEVHTHLIEISQPTHIHAARVTKNRHNRGKVCSQDKYSGALRLGTATLQDIFVCCLMCSISKSINVTDINLH